MTPTESAAARHPYLSAVGAGGMLGGPLAALLLWHWWLLLLGLAVFVGTAVAAAALDVRRQVRLSLLGDLMRYPKCTHSPQTVRVSSHVDLTGPDTLRAPRASTYCCRRPACLAAAEAWVRGHGCREVHVIPLPRPH